jgi:hypothetical protein
MSERLPPLIGFVGRLLALSCFTYVVFLLVKRFINVSPELRIGLTVLGSAPLWAHIMTPYLVMLLPALLSQAKHDALAAWNGRYYSFDGRQLRMLIVDGTIWVAAADLDVLLLPPPDARELRILGADFGLIPEQKFKGYTENGIARLLATRTNIRLAKPAMIKLRHWFEKETLPNLRRVPGSALNS